jgi:hypothetical protein
MNEKNELGELLGDLGCSANCAEFQPEQISLGHYRSTVIVAFPDGRKIQEVGEGEKRVSADIAAARIALELWRNDYPDLIIDWDRIYLDAQRGDTLIKLGIYSSEDLINADEASKRLQKLESDHYLAKVFDCWKAQENPDLAIWGNVLSEKRKATLVEALLWRRFKIDAAAENMLVPLQSLLKTLAVE